MRYEDLPKASYDVIKEWVRDPLDPRIIRGMVTVITPEGEQITAMPYEKGKPFEIKDNGLSAFTMYENEWRLTDLAVNIINKHVEEGFDIDPIRDDS